MAKKNFVAVSVIITSYNSEKFIEESIRSILNQTYKNFELIIVDDSSTDKTRKIIDRYKEKDKRIKTKYNKKNLGAAATFNIGIKAAKGDFIVKMDSDDISMKNRIELQLLEFFKRPNLQVLGGNIKIIKNNQLMNREIKFPIGKQNIDKIIRNSVPVADPTVMIRKSVLKKVNYLRENMEAAEDYDLWLRIHDLGYEIDNIDKTLLYYRHHNQQLSLVKSEEQSIKSLIAIKLSDYRRANNIKNDLLKTKDLVNINFLRKLPSDIKPSELEIFEFRNILISSFDVNEILSRLSSLKKISKDNHSPEILSRIYARCAYGMYKNKNYKYFILFFIQALNMKPRSVVFIFFNYFKGRFFG